MKKISELQKELTYSRKNFWKEFSTETEKAFQFNEGYKNFLDHCKTERECTDFYEKRLTELGYKPLDTENQSTKYFRTSRNKNVAIAQKGKLPVSAGVNLIVSHIDAPRVDFKQSPLAEDSSSGLGIIKTHYYGGIKKYQWSQRIYT